MYVHAGKRLAATVVANSTGDMATCASVEVVGITEAEEIAVALAVAEGYSKADP